jgi:ABC-type glutathione transport system ATPase component
MTRQQTKPRPNDRKRIDRNGDNHLIDLREVVKTFQTAAGEFTALEDVNLQVDAGEYVGVVGKSGSGKSTLINKITDRGRGTRRRLAGPHPV